MVSTQQELKTSLLNERNLKIYFRIKVINLGLSGKPNLQNNVLHKILAGLTVLQHPDSTLATFQVK